MEQKYDLTDIGNALSRVMDNPMTKIIRSGSIGVLGVVNPVSYTHLDVYKRQHPEFPSPDFWLRYDQFHHFLP